MRKLFLLVVLISFFNATSGISHNVYSDDQSSGANVENKMDYKNTSLRVFKNEIIAMSYDEEAEEGVDPDQDSVFEEDMDSDEYYAEEDDNSTFEEDVDSDEYDMEEDEDSTFEEDMNSDKYDIKEDEDNTLDKDMDLDEYRMGGDDDYYYEHDDKEGVPSDQSVADLDAGRKTEDVSKATTVSESNTGQVISDIMKEDDSKEEAKGKKKISEILDDPRNEVEEVGISYKWSLTRQIIGDIERREYDQANNHLPKIYNVEDYYTQVFYCIKNNDVSGLRSLINKLEELGISLSSILSHVRTVDSGDNLLIYAVRLRKIDIVRFLLSIGSALNIVNYDNESPLSMAIKSGRVDIVHAVLTMQQ